MLDLVHEFAGGLEVDVGGEEGLADLAEGVGDVVLGEPADAAQVAEGLAQLV